MSFSFGSFGDIITLCSIVIATIKTLDDSRGSSKEYQDIVDELKSLERVLSELHNLDKTCAAHADFSALGATVKLHAAECWTLLNTFREEIKKYENFLAKDSKHKFTDKYWKLHWGLTKKDYVSQFRCKVRDRVANITLLLVTAGLNSKILEDHQLRKLVEDGRTEDKKVFQAYTTQLTTMKNETRKTTQFAFSSYVLSYTGIKCLQAFQFDIMSRIQMLLKVCIDTRDAVLSLASQINRPLNPCSQVAFLNDALGRPHPIHLDSIDCWKTFDYHMAAKFSDMPGERKIKNHEYILEDARTKQEIKAGTHWTICFQPGREIDMVLVFEEQLPQLKLSEEKCLRCGKENAGIKGSIVKCDCGLEYRLISTPSPGITTINTRRKLDTTPDRLPSQNTIGPVLSAKYGEPNDRPLLLDENPGDFKRVCVIYSQSPIRPTKPTRTPAWKSMLFRKENSWRDRIIVVYDPAERRLWCEDKDKFVEANRPHTRVPIPGTDMKVTFTLGICESTSGTVTLDLSKLGNWAKKQRKAVKMKHIYVLGEEVTARNASEK